MDNISVWCRLGFHRFELEYRSAPGFFTVGEKEVEIQGEVERCTRQNCGRLFFSVDGGQRFPCDGEEQRRRRYSQNQREGRVLVLS